MAIEKGVQHGEHETESPTNAVADEFGSDALDQLAMQRMGKTQEMNRVFRQVSLISFTAIIMGTWQWMLLANTQGLVDGGRGGLFWSYI
jgi:choline transport protein